MDAQFLLTSLDTDSIVGDSIVDAAIDHSGIISSTGTNHIDTSRLISCFVEWDNTLAEIALPDSNSPFLLRKDCGSYSQHRWSFLDGKDEIMQLVLKHNSCLKAIFVQTLCRNCQHRETWRQPCTQPQNIFYILHISGIERCKSLLEPLIHKRVYLSDESIMTYKSSLPKPVLHWKPINPKAEHRLARLQASVERNMVKLQDGADEDGLSLLLKDANDLLEESKTDTKHPKPDQLDVTKCSDGKKRKCRSEELNTLPDAKRCLLYTSPSPRDRQKSRMPSSA